MALLITLLTLWCTVLGLRPSEATPVYLYKQSSALVSSPRPLTKSQIQGGPGGVPFDDILLKVGSRHVVGVWSINISASNRIDSFQVTYLLSDGSFYPGPLHGNTTRPPARIVLGRQSYVDTIDGQTDGSSITQLTITTRGPEHEADEYGPFGSSGAVQFRFQGCTTGFYGAASKHLDRLGVYTLPNAKKGGMEFGGISGEVFDEDTMFRNPPIVGVSKLFIRHGDYISSIQAEYLLLGDVPVPGKKHGGDEGNLTTITFDKGEKITSIEGLYGDSYVSQLTFVTLKAGKAGGIKARYGPFGRMGSSPISIEGNVLGFYGKASQYLNSLGVYYI